MKDHITTDITDNIRHIMKEWVLVFQIGAQQGDTVRLLKFATRFDSYAASSGQIRIEKSFLMDLSSCLDDLLRIDITSMSDVKKRNIILGIQNEARELVAWISALLFVAGISSPDDNGEIVVSSESDGGVPVYYINF